MEMIDKYTFRVQWSEDDEVYLANCLEFPSLMTHGETQVDAIDELKVVLRFAVNDLSAKGKSIPTPLGERQFKGNISLRIPPETHEQLFYNASEENLSLNQYITTVIEKNLYENRINRTFTELSDAVKTLSAEIASLRLINEKLKASIYSNTDLVNDTSFSSNYSPYSVQDNDEIAI
jgi:predicted HicB family RNase H-like nuclease